MKSWIALGLVCTLGDVICAVAQPHPPAANPFCGVSTARGGETLTLACENGVIDVLPFAAYGTPSIGPCPNFTHSPACDDTQFPGYAASTCVGQAACTLVAPAADPCPGTIKSIAAVAHCSLPPGGYVPLPSPSCALNGQPCPPPTWAPEWNLTLSTIINPESDDFFAPVHPWGLVALDWTCAHNEWWSGNVTNSTCEATSVEGCRRLKAAGLAARCFIYHNNELALQWLESQRVLLDDPTQAGLFLQYRNTQGGPPNGTVYLEMYREKYDFGAMGFWDFTQSAATAAFISSVIESIADPAVDGTYLDDPIGVPQEHPLAQAATNMSDAQLEELQFATQQAGMSLIEQLVATGKYVWAAFGNQDGVEQGPSRESCVAWMRSHCEPAMQGAPMAMQFNKGEANISVAAFLIVRPPYGWLGGGWESDDSLWDDIFLLQVGTPLGLCEEGPPGTFSRVWSAGTAVLNCSSWNAELPFPALEPTQ